VDGDVLPQPDKERAGWRMFALDGEAAGTERERRTSPYAPTRRAQIGITVRERATVISCGTRYV
jgi:hypothetical protein